MEANKKDSVATYSAVGMLVWGIVLTTTGFFISPVGEVHDSVLWILGQILIYAGSIFGLTIYAKGKIMEIDRRVDSKLGRREKEQEEESEDEYDKEGE